MSTAAISLHYIWDIPSHFCFCFCFLLLLGLCLFRKSMVFSSRNSGRIPVLPRCSDGRINATRWYCVYSCVTNATGSSWIKLAHTRWTIKHSRENLKKKKMRIKCVCVRERDNLSSQKNVSAVYARTRTTKDAGNKRTTLSYTRNMLLLFLSNICRGYQRKSRRQRE